MASISTFISPIQPLSSSLVKASIVKCRRPLTPQSVHKPSRLSSEGNLTKNITEFERRIILISSVGLLTGAVMNAAIDGVAAAAEFADMPALKGKDYGKTKMRYPDYTETESGLQYKDLRAGTGPTPKTGETVVVKLENLSKNCLTSYPNYS